MSSNNTNNRTNTNDNEDESSIDSGFNQIESENDEFNVCNLYYDYDQNEKEKEEKSREELTEKQIKKIGSISSNRKEEQQDKNINKNEEINSSLNSSIKFLQKKRNNSKHH